MRGPDEVQDQHREKADHEKDAKALKFGFALNKAGVLDTKDDASNQKTRDDGVQGVGAHEVRSFLLDRQVDIEPAGFAAVAVIAHLVDADAIGAVLRQVDSCRIAEG